VAHPRLRHSGESDDGFTLVEVVAAFVVFAIAAVAVVALLGSALAVTRKNQTRVQAGQVASQAVQTARDAVKNSLAIPDDSTKTVRVGSTNFTVATHATWTNAGATGSSCTGGVPGQVAYRRISASVTWPNMSGTPAVTSATIATPLNPNTITVPVQLVAGDKTPIPNQTITLTPPSGQPKTATTDSNGCVIFAQLTPQKYTVGVSIDGYVDSTSAAATNHTEQVGQSIPGITPVTVIFYDHPATLNITPAYDPGFAPATYRLPSSGMVVTVGQTGWSDGSAHVYNAPNGALNDTVFPWAVAPGSGYSAYAGGCAADATTSSTVSTALGTPAAGGAAALAVPVYSRLITVRYRGSGVSGATIQVTDSPDGCSDTYTLAGTTSSSGAIAFSLPYGDYVFSARIGSRTRTSGPVAITSSSSVNNTVDLS
jgi:Tfp pilus assembly protein PilV